MTYSFDPTVGIAGKMTIVGEGTALSPIGAIDIYNADKAGTLALHDRDGISAVDGAPVNCTYALRPQNEVLMGGAKQDLWIVIANWANMTTATIRLIGTDENDAALTEDIVVTANGTYYATKLFKTLTQTQVTVFTKTDAGSFDYELVQGQWGAVYKSDDGDFFRFDCQLFFTGATPNYFKETNKTLEFTDLVWFYPCFSQFGEQANDRGYNGCTIIGCKSTANEYWRNIGGGMKLYGCRLYDVKFECWKRVEMLNCIWQDSYLYFGSMSDVEEAACKFRNVWLSNTNIGCSGSNPFMDVENFYIVDYPSYALYTWNFAEVETFKNLTFIGNYQDLRIYKAEINIVDFDFDKTKMVQYATAPHIWHVFFTLNLKLIDKDNNPVVGATVKAYKKGDYSDHTPTGPPVIDTTTDGNGDIPEQTVESFKIDELVETSYYPFLFILEHASYPTKKFRIDIIEPRNKWVFAYGLEEAATHDEILKAIKLNKALLFAT